MTATFLLALTVVASPILGHVLADEESLDQDISICNLYGLPVDLYLESETLVLAIGSDAIHSHRFTKAIFDTAWTSPTLRELRRTSETSGYEVLEFQSIVVVNVSAGVANVFIPTVLIGDINPTRRLIAIVDVENQVVVDAVQTSVGWEECWWNPPNYVWCLDCCYVKWLECRVGCLKIPWACESCTFLYQTCVLACCQAPPCPI